MVGREVAAQPHGTFRPDPSTHHAKTGTDHRHPAERLKPVHRNEKLPAINNHHPHTCHKTHLLLLEPFGQLGWTEETECPKMVVVSGAGLTRGGPQRTLTLTEGVIRNMTKEVSLGDPEG